MSNSITPNFAQNIPLSGALASAVAITRGTAPVEGTIDLRGMRGAHLMINVAKGGTAAISAGLSIRVHPRVIRQASPLITMNHVGSNLDLNTDLVTVTGNQICATSDSAAGQNTLTLNAGTGYSAGDIISITDAGLTRLEWAIVSKVSGAALILVDPLQYTHTAAAGDAVRNKAQSFPRLWVPGGDIMAIVADYGAEATGDPMTILVVATEDIGDTIV